jgi:choline kinase
MPLIKHAVISCAGLGSRLGMDIPKCLLPIGSNKLIDYILDLLEDIPSIRIVVGFKAQEVMDYVSKRRNDVIFVYNHNFASTSNTYSVYLATRHLKEPYLMVDGDLLIEKESFNTFISKISYNKSLLGVTTAKTDDAVFTEVKDNQVCSFSRQPISKLEWSGIAYFADISMSENGKYVYQELEPCLPLTCHEIDCFEIDTQSDLDFAMKNFSFIR